MEDRLLEILKNQLTVARGVAIELCIENPERQELLDLVNELKEKVNALTEVKAEKESVWSGVWDGNLSRKTECGSGN